MHPIRLISACLFVFNPNPAIPKIPPTFVVKPQNLKVEVGKQAEFSCKCKGFPTPEIKWYKAGTEIQKDKKYLIQKGETPDGSESTLVVVDVTEEGAGTYKAVAVNQHGEAQIEAELIGKCQGVGGAY